MANKSNLPKLNVQHDYITLKLPIGNFTTSFGGSKASGELVQMKGAFEKLDNYVQTASKSKSIGESMNDLLDTKLLNKLVPGWDKPTVADSFTEGDKVKFTVDAFAKKYPGVYEVAYMKRKNVFLKIMNSKTSRIENVGVSAISVEKV